MSNQHDNQRYFIVSCGKHYLFIDSEGKRTGDNYNSSLELVQKHEACRVPLNKISLTPPGKDFLTRVLTLYVTEQPLEPVEIDSELKARIEGC